MGKKRTQTTTIIHGQADPGKSTPGHLIYKCVVINKQNTQKFDKDTAKYDFEYAWVLDEQS